MNNLTSIATTLNNMGGIYQEKREFDKVLQTYEEALEIFKDSDQSGDIRADILNNMGVVYVDKREFDKALKNYKND